MEGLGKIVTLCLQIVPVIMFVGSILAFFNLVNVGPRELPRKHPLNRQMAVPVLITAIGMFMIPLPDLLGTVGLVLCIGGIFWYAFYFRKARLEYPAMTDAEWLKAAKARYGRMRDFDPKAEQEDSDEEKEK